MGEFSPIYQLSCIHIKYQKIHYVIVNLTCVRLNKVRNGFFILLCSKRVFKDEDQFQEKRGHNYDYCNRIYNDITS